MITSGRKSASDRREFLCVSVALWWMFLYAGMMRMLMSTARAECVKAPTEM